MKKQPRRRDTELQSISDSLGEALLCRSAAACLGQPALVRAQQ